MRYVFEGRDFDDVDAFVKAVNAERLSTPKAWFAYVGTVAGRPTRLKTYGCGYLQILEIDGINYGGGMDMKPNAWKTALKEAFERAARRNAA